MGVLDASLRGSCARSPRPLRGDQRIAQDEAAEAKAAVCVACHGPNGNSPTPKFPILAGQTARYLYLQLQRLQGRPAQRAADVAVRAGPDRDDMLDLAAFFAAQRPRAPAFKVDPRRPCARGKPRPTRRCARCATSAASQGQNEIPRVAGQHYDYIVKQLQDFKARDAPTTPAT